MLILALSLAGVGHAQRGDLPEGPIAEPVIPTAAGISFHQVTFAFDAGRLVNTDWGQIQIDPRKWGNVTGRSSGFVQVVLYPSASTGPGRNDPAWVVRNLFVPRESVKPCPDPSVPGRDAAGSLTTHPLCRHFDLVPGAEGRERLTSIAGAVLVSAQPLPETAEILRVLSQFPAQTLRVEQVFINAEGAYFDGPPAFPGPLVGYELVGPPPLPPGPDPGPGLPGDLAFQIEIFQADQPNIECARNQCVPMANSLVFAYLESRYNHLPLLWNLSHNYATGIGRMYAAGDVPFWAPEPPTSLVANVDALSRRIGVASASTGEGTSGCNNFLAALSYLATEDQYAKAVVRHQGGDPVYGENASCDNDTWILGGLVSTREGETPTWSWIFQQLQLGRGVSILFGRYNPLGERTSGHMVRVWGATRFNGKDYLYTLDDGEQGANNTGLRTEVWEVADTGGPGAPGVPDGQLNMDGLSWEIERAISVEAKPTLLIP